MSTTTLREFLSTDKKNLSKVRNVDLEQQKKLAEFVRKTRKEKGLSTPDVERNSGNTITDGYVSQIENLYIKNVSPEKLTALAKGLGIAEEEIFSIVRGKEPNPEAMVEERFKLISLKFRDATGDKRRDAESLVRALERALQDS